MPGPEWISPDELARIREQHPHIEQDSLLDPDEGEYDGPV